jgi:hypothetical protein
MGLKVKVATGPCVYWLLGEGRWTDQGGGNNPAGRAGSRYPSADSLMTKNDKIKPREVKLPKPECLIVSMVTGTK